MPLDELEAALPVDGLVWWALDGLAWSFLSSSVILLLWSWCFSCY